MLMSPKQVKCPLSHLFVTFLYTKIKVQFQAKCSTMYTWGYYFIHTRTLLSNIVRFTNKNLNPSDNLIIFVTPPRKYCQTIHTPWQYQGRLSNHTHLDNTREDCQTIHTPWHHQKDSNHTHTLTTSLTPPPRDCHIILTTSLCITTSTNTPHHKFLHYIIPHWETVLSCTGIPPFFG